MTSLLIATNNVGKIKEIRALLQDMHLEAEILAPAQIGLDLHVEENGNTYAENAARKAIAFAQVSGLPVLADDSGLEVDALNGSPGIRSARFSPLPNATDAGRRAYLLERLEGHPRPWTARFRCVVAVTKPENSSNQVEDVRFSEGVCPGEIIPEERGNNGFGYDPLFLIPALNRTMAELTMPEKNRLSHRAHAVRAARTILIDVLKITT